MKIPFFSVIVPVYNCETYLHECIDSVINQTFSDWELILIDDGSSDASGEICDKYGALDERIVVIHKSNGGEFSARKAGIDAARGKYVIGLDGDDYFLNHHLGRIYSSIINSDVDCVIFPVQYVGERNGMSNTALLDGMILSREELLLYCINNGDSSFCDKAIRTELYKMNDYSDAPEVRFSEDEIMVYPVLCYIENAEFINLDSYCYRINNCSASSKHEYRYIEYRDQVTAYDIKKIRESGNLSKVIKAALLRDFLRMLNVRVWDLMLRKQWNDSFAERTENLKLYNEACSSYNAADYGVKETIRVYLLIKKRYHIMKFLAGIYRMLGSNGVI